ncbi:hypothetical protein SuNHUV7_22380 (plasmid) [Pseudoseohaeicola sp. NH-UV-7]|uniref:hypothetical protein n=1 Tax=Sulfitobacter sp. TBRI5 TaxID=2989732 RepID=UPI003A687435
MELREAANLAAYEFLATQYRQVRDSDVGLVRNIILDRLYASPASPNFIEETLQNPSYKRAVTRLLKRMKPEFVEIMDRTFELYRDMG